MRTALIALLALLLAAAPAAAQKQSERVQRVYRDYRDDGVVTACKHERAALKETLDDLPASADVETPDLRPVLEAAIEQHKDGDCKDADQSQPSSGTGSGGSAGSTDSSGASTPVPSTTFAPPVTGEGSTGSTPLNPPANTPDSSPSEPRTIAPATGGEAGSPPTSKDVTPVPEATPAPTPPAAVPPEPSGPVATPSIVYSNPDDDLPPSLLVVVAVAALLALLALLYAVAARTGRLAGPRRATREAAFRLGGTWGDFSDWLRTGR